MRVIDKRVQDPTKTVEELPLGQAYLDRLDILCIKTREAVDEYCSCLAYVDDKWQADKEYKLERVTPVSTALIIEG